MQQFTPGESWDEMLQFGLTFKHGQSQVDILWWSLCHLWIASPSPSSSQFVFNPSLPISNKTPPQRTRGDTSAEFNCENLALIELENKYHPMVLRDGNHVKYISLSSSITRECCFVSLSRVEVKHYLISRMVLGNKYEILSVFIFYCRCNPLDRLSSIINVPCIREPH